MKGNENLLACNPERLSIPHHNGQVSFKVYSSRFEICPEIEILVLTLSPYQLQ